MSKAVLISIQPKWCELIASGKKTVEVRKTKPKLDTPFKVYIYQTKRAWIYNIFSRIADWQKRVIGEFLCDEIYDIGYSPYNHGGFISDIDRCLSNTDDLYKKSCLDLEEMFNYLSQGYGYGWHISDLKIYDTPKELSAFKKINRDCWYADLGLAKRDCPECKNKECFMSKPPQSWCYVEELSV